MAQVCVFGLWHLGCVTAACLAAAGHSVVGLDFDETVVSGLRSSKPPLFEPDLANLIASGLAMRRLRFTTDSADALGNADALWVAFDTPVDENDVADAAFVRQQVEAVRPFVRRGSLVLVSSQVPVGFTSSLEHDWQAHDSTLQFSYSPENLRLGSAIEAFRHPARVVIGADADVDRSRLASLFAPFCSELIWMSISSAEMTKHALNAFLALSVVYANELARICEHLGVDTTQVEDGLRTDPRIGAKAYISPGAPIAGGTLARDVTTLNALANDNHVAAPLIQSIGTSNRIHEQWLWKLAFEQVRDVNEPTIALLGLTYKAGTDTLRRSPAVSMARWLVTTGVRVRAFDPSVAKPSPELSQIDLVAGLDEALIGADLAIIMTPHAEFRMITAERLVSRMRHPQLLDPSRFLSNLREGSGVRYLTIGQPREGVQS